MIETNQINSVLVTWRTSSDLKKSEFQMGRFYLGSSPFAHIQVPDDSNEICAILEVNNEKISLQCTAPYPSLFVEGQRLKLNETVDIGDILEIMVGRTPVLFTHGRVKTMKDHLPRRTDKKNPQKYPDKSGVFATDIANCHDDIDQVKLTVSRRLLDLMNLAGIELAELNSPEVRETARLKLKKLLSDLAFPESFVVPKEQLEAQIFDEVMGLGPLEPLLADPTVTEIMVNRRDQIYIERAGRIQTSPINFSSDQSLLNVIERIVSTVGRRIDKSSPVVDARLLDGSRVNAVIPPIAIHGPSLTIRRFSKKPISVDKLCEHGSLTQGLVAFSRLLVVSHKNLIISGGTGSGKTTLLNALSSFIPEQERIITVEDAAELQLQQPHVISLETRPANLEGKGSITIRDLVKNTLRMRPDRIIVGECRSGEALDMLQAMNTGHDGSMTTAHANSAEDMLRRLETMVLMAGIDLPLRAIREQITSALCVVIQQTRRKNGKRLVTGVTWIKPLDRNSGDYVVCPLFERDREEQGHWHAPHLEEFWEQEELQTSAAEFIEYCRKTGTDAVK